jgi:hypothetical protein
MSTKEMARHPLSALFERFDLQGDDLQTLVDDIKHEGLLNPITTHDGMILDGWNRYQACLRAKVRPIFISLAPGLDPWEFVKGANMLRRHMSPAERVAVMLLKMQMDGAVKIDHPSTREIESDIEVSHGTAVKAQQIAKAQDPSIAEALAGGRVSLDQAAKISKLPQEERKAAIEAPKPPAKPTTPDDRDARIAELTRLLAERDAEIEDLRERLADTGALLKTTQEDFERMERVMDAEDLLAAYQKEVKANVELARVVQSQNNGLMVENSDLKNRLKSALRKIERLTGKPPIPLEVA